MLQFHITLIKGNNKEYANLIKDTIRFVEDSDFADELKEEE